MYPYWCVFVTTVLIVVLFLHSITVFRFPLFEPVMYTMLGYEKGNMILVVVVIIVRCLM